MAWSMIGRLDSAACSCVVSSWAWARICALWTATAAGVANSSPSSAARSSNAWPEARPHLLPAEGPRAHGATLLGRGDARPLVEGGVLDLIDLRDERVARGQYLDTGVTAVRAEQCDADAVRAGDGANGKGSHVLKNIVEPKATGHEGGKFTQALLKVCGVRVLLDLADRAPRRGDCCR